MTDRSDSLEPHELSTLLDEATSWIERPGLAGVALRTARRRRHQRRGISAALVASAAVLVVVATTVGGPVVAGRTPPAVTQTPDSDPPTTAPDPQPLAAGPIELDDVQRAWDPDDIECSRGTTPSACHVT